MFDRAQFSVMHFFFLWVLSVRMGEVMVWKQTIYNLNRLKQLSLFFTHATCSVEDGKVLGSVVTQVYRLILNTQFHNLSGEGKRMCLTESLKSDICHFTFYLPKQVTRPHVSSTGQGGIIFPEEEKPCNSEEITVYHSLGADMSYP